MKASRREQERKDSEARKGSKKSEVQLEPVLRGAKRKLPDTQPRKIVSRDPVPNTGTL